MPDAQPWTRTDDVGWQRCEPAGERHALTATIDLLLQMMFDQRNRPIHVSRGLSVADRVVGHAVLVVPRCRSALHRHDAIGILLPCPSAEQVGE